jgi:sugar lactone lactonase YvrE
MAGEVKLRYVSSIYTDMADGGLTRPEGVACAEKTFVVVADSANSRLLRYSLVADEIKAEAEIKLPGQYPIRLEINSKGEIFVLDGRQRSIARLGPGGEGRGNLELKDIPFPRAFIPRSLAIDGEDNIYVLDVFSERVLVLNPGGQYLRHIKFPPDYGFFSDVDVNFKGDVLLLYSINAVVYSASRDAKGFSPLTRSLKGYLNFPTSLTSDKKGTIYLSDQNGSGIIVIAQDGSYLGRQTGYGWDKNLLYYPSQICVNGAEEIFVADRNNNRVQVYRAVKGD